MNTRRYHLPTKVSPILSQLEISRVIFSPPQLSTLRLASAESTKKPLIQRITRRGRRPPSQRSLWNQLQLLRERFRINQRSKNLLNLERQPSRWIGWVRSACLSNLLISLTSPSRGSNSQLVWRFNLQRHSYGSVEENQSL